MRFVKTIAYGRGRLEDFSSLIATIGLVPS